MKKIGKLSESRMVKPEEPKTYPLVSDDLFENAVKGYPSKGIKGGTKAAAKVAAKKKLEEDDLPMNQRGRITQAGRAPKVTPKTYQTYNSMTDAKDPDWIQGAEDDIERRGTEGKCTPITKPGCTGKAKTLAKTFKKMAKKRKAKNEANLNVGPHSQALANRTMTPDQQTKLKKQRDDWRSKLRPTGDDGRGGKPSPHSTKPKVESSTPKPVRQARARAQAGKPIKKGTAKMVASDPGQDLGTAMKAGEKL